MANSGNTVFSRNKGKRRSKSQTAVFVVAFIILAAYAAYVLAFFLFGFVLSLKDYTYTVGDGALAPKYWDYLSTKGLLFTLDSHSFRFMNYFDAFTSFTVTGLNGSTINYLQMLWNSIWRTVVMTGVNWFCTVTVCYVLVHYKNKLTKFIYSLGLILSIIPLYGAGAAEYRLFSNDVFPLINSPLIYLSQITLFGTNFFYMYAFWKSISPEYKEAGLIDGASHLGIYLRVMLPMLVPSAISLFIMLFISNWNNYEYTNLYMRDYSDLSYGIYVYRETAIYNGNGTWPIYFAGVMMSFLPILLLFIAFQNTIMEKVYIGGLKG